MADRIPTTRLSGERVLDDEGVSGVRRSGARDRRPIRALIVTLVMVAVVTLCSPAYSTCSVRLIMSS